MATSFINQKKKQKYLILVFVGVILVTVFVWWKGFLTPEKAIEPTVAEPPREIKVNFEVLENPILKELLPFEEIEMPEQLGRENPFLPY